MTQMQELQWTEDVKKNKPGERKTHRNDLFLQQVTVT